MESTDSGTLELESSQVFLDNFINAVVGQVIVPLRERSLQLIHNIPEEVKSLTVHGDQARIQQFCCEQQAMRVKAFSSHPGEGRYMVKMTSTNQSKPWSGIFIFTKFVVKHRN